MTLTSLPLMISLSSSSTTRTVPLKGPCTESVLIRFALFMRSPSTAFLTTIALNLKLSPPPESSTNILVNNLPIRPNPYKTTSWAFSRTEPFVPIRSFTAS